MKSMFVPELNKNNEKLQITNVRNNRVITIEAKDIKIIVSNTICLYLYIL